MPTSSNGLKLELKGLGSEVRSKLRLGLDVDLESFLGSGLEQPLTSAHSITLEDPAVKSNCYLGLNFPEASELFLIKVIIKLNFG